FQSTFTNDSTVTLLSTLSLHDALPISCNASRGRSTRSCQKPPRRPQNAQSQHMLGVLSALRGCFLTVISARPCWPAIPIAWRSEDRKSTRLNSSHEWISYAVFSLKKKNSVSVQIRLAQSLVQETEVGRAGLEDTAVQQHG